jgi:hypothetical protein
MYTTSGNSNQVVDCGGKLYRVYYNSKSKKGRGICDICGRKKYFFSVTRVIGVEEYHGNEIDKDSDLSKEIVEKLKRVVRRETVCDYCSSREF